MSGEPHPVEALHRPQQIPIRIGREVASFHARPIGMAVYGVAVRQTASTLADASNAHSPAFLQGPVPLLRCVVSERTGPLRFMISTSRLRPTIAATSYDGKGEHRRLHQATSVPDLTYVAMTSTAAATARVLADAGITRVFGLPGGEVLVLMDELRRAGVDFVLMRHEANAGIAAAVYGKLRGQPGVVLPTLGPGAANLMLPLCSSYLDQEPLLAISAQIPDDFPVSHTHQLLPLHDVYRPVARYVDKITGGNVFDVVPRALEKCMERPFGAAYLTLSTREAPKPAQVSRPKAQGST